MNRYERTSHTDGLLADQRGAVMVVGVFMAAFLVGAVWYIIGIGDAILYRQRMQDGADAVAFAAALYHARGMNIIAMINIIMAAILAILIAFKLVQLMNYIAMAISCACATFSTTCAAVCGFTTGFAPVINRAVQVAENLVNTTLPVLSKTQVGVAVTMPWIAQGKAAQVATQYSEPVTAGGMVSASLVPFVPEQRLGLPVEEDDYQFLCKKAGTYVGELVFSPFGRFAGWVSGAVGNLVSTFPGYFCGSSGGSGSITPYVSQSSINAKAAEACAGESGRSRRRCIRNVRRGSADALRDQQYARPGVDGSNKTSKRVFSGAKNGNDYFQVWSVLGGNERWPRRAEKGVKIAAWNQSMTMPEVPWGSVAIAQAEFYYDESGDWDEYKEDAMWNMFWRARLRRTRPPMDAVAGLFSDGIFARIGLGGLVDSFEVGWLLGDLDQEAVESAVGAVHVGGSQWQGEYITHPFLDNRAKVEVIH